MKSWLAIYSSPEYSFKAIADLWTDYLRASRIINNDDLTAYCSPPQAAYPAASIQLSSLFLPVAILATLNRIFMAATSLGLIEVQGGEGN